jgi:hypothetical protein
MLFSCLVVVGVITGQMSSAPENLRNEASDDRQQIKTAVNCNEFPSEQNVSYVTRILGTHMNFPIAT